MLWNALSEKFLNGFFSSKRKKELRGKIFEFILKNVKYFFQSWDRYKGYLKNRPHHCQSKEIIRHNFIKLLKPESKSLLDVITKGEKLSKSYDEIEVLLNLMSGGHQDYSESNREFTSTQKMLVKLVLD